jgi:hypothetical protein
MAVPKTTPQFEVWTGSPLSYTFGGKRLLDYRGEPCFAELAIVRAFLGAGWSARWVSTFASAAMSPRFLTGWRDGQLSDQTQEPIEDKSVRAKVDAIAVANGRTYAGCWDVVAWNRDRLLFAESKLKGRDKIRSTQRRWLAAGLSSGLSIDDFLIVEWSS